MKCSLFLFTLSFLVLSPRVTAAPAAAETLQYKAPFFPGTKYNSAVPTIKDLTGRQLQNRPFSVAEIQTSLRAWDTASSRAKLVEYARTHEDRPLYYMIISSPLNLKRIGRIQAGWKKLADPRTVSEKEAGRLLEDLPAVAWLGYSIHGNETSGADAALFLIYHLCASMDKETEALLKDLVIIIDPTMNPDGRHRTLNQTEQHRNSLPSIDNQSLLHRGTSPSGRTNHYFFDLNRDWLLAVHPESRGRIKAVSSWNPLLLIDAHEMGSLNTYLFPPARKPINPNMPGHLRKWNNVFARDQAAAFDRHMWLYYNGEWLENWYPGYSTSWNGFRGTICILYEQAGIREDGVLRPEGRVLTYRESVHHQAKSSMANLTTLKKHRQEIAESFVKSKRRAVDPKGPFAKHIFAVLPTENTERLNAFLDLMHIQGVETYRASADFTAEKAEDQLGVCIEKITIPKGTILIPNRQPLAPLVSALLEFDPSMSAEFLATERRELLRNGSSKLYDVTAWNITMMYDLPSLELKTDLPECAERLNPAKQSPAFKPLKKAPTIAYAINGADDASVTCAAKLLTRGIKVRVADKESRFGARIFPRGSVFVLKRDNLAFQGNLHREVSRIARSCGVDVAGIGTGFGPGDLLDMGGRHFKLLNSPKVAIACYEGFSWYDFGSLLFLLDKKLGITVSRLNAGALSGTDLRRYNVLILPHRRHGSFSSSTIEKLKNWAEQGGTLIGVGGSAQSLCHEKSNIGSVRLLPDVLDKLDDYELAVLREWMSRTASPEPGKVFAHTAEPGIKYPWDAPIEKRPELPVLKRRDAWQRIFMPQGAIVAGRTDQRHWLTFGCRELLPMLFSDNPLLMAKGNVQAAVRLGVFRANNAGKNKQAEPKQERTGWSAVPDGCRLYLRMSGLLWPEAAQRMANAAWLTRERIGNGQVILFASPPNFRGAALGTARLFLNAVVYGPGMGARQPIRF